MILYTLIKNYMPIVVLVPTAMAIAARIYNRKAVHKVSSLAASSVLLGLLNWQNLMTLQHFCMSRHIGGPYLWGGGSGVAFSFPVAVSAVVFGHLALRSVRKNEMARGWRMLAYCGLLLSYPYVAWWLIFIARWCAYAATMSHGHGP